MWLSGTLISTGYLDVQSILWIFGLDIDNEIKNLEEQLQTQLLNIELEEKKLVLFERQVKLRKEVAKAETIELQNQQLKLSMV
ncbi:hypothetical protein RCL_jg13074.t1 [Rhizophagus clarus]|uniref:Uncharacterized protein n=1 Tax=Rhizophagus clarus TaxID=94130 RepID=A0A8H3KUA3_9GLOM|nr:hypothetical protein RCL_jg13074.t1 [Rhizophagus clarus]